MAPRAILLLVFVSILSAGMVRVDAAPKLPSKKASVVIPLLEKLDIVENTSPRDAMDQMQKILGTFLAGDVSGFGSHRHIQYTWILDDQTNICMTYDSGKLVAIDAHIPGNGLKTFYPKPTP